MQPMPCAQCGAEIFALGVQCCGRDFHPDCYEDHVMEDHGG